MWSAIFSEPIFSDRKYPISKIGNIRGGSRTPRPIKSVVVLFLFLSQGKLTFERIKTQKQLPKLKAKAAATRHLTCYAVNLCEIHNSGTLHDRRRLACCKFIARFCEVVARDERWAPTAEREALAEGVRVFMSAYNALAQEALSQGIRNWKMTA